MFLQFCMRSQVRNSNRYRSLYALNRTRYLSEGNWWRWAVQRRGLRRASASVLSSPLRNTLQHFPACHSHEWCRTNTGRRGGCRVQQLNDPGEATRISTFSLRSRVSTTLSAIWGWGPLIVFERVKM
jgi:hypothetical protein